MKLKTLEFCLPALLVPSFIQIFFDLRIDFMNVKPIRFLFIQLPPYHMFTNASLLLLAVFGYYMFFDKMRFFKRVFFVGCMSFLAMCGHEVYANVFNLLYLYGWNAYKHWTSLPWLVMISTTVFICVVSRFTRVNFSTNFILFAIMGAGVYIAQPIFHFDWSTADIMLSNEPYIWVLAKAITYVMWWFLVI